MADAQNMSLAQGNFLSHNPPSSPHKLNRGNKLRRYEEAKGGGTAVINFSNKDMEELQRTFSPINSQKTFGYRIGLANQKKQGMNGQFESPQMNNRTINMTN